MVHDCDIAELHGHVPSPDRYQPPSSSGIQLAHRETLHEDALMDAIQKSTGNIRNSAET
jgi:hypothetical protein